MINKIIKEYYDILVGIARAFPLIVPLTSLIYGFIFNNNVGIFFGVYAYLCDMISHFFKRLAQQIYGDKESISILGIGRRPTGAKYCGLFISESNLSGKSTSFGMPSGHSASAILTLIFWVYYVWNKNNKNLRTLLSIILIVLICLSICVSRVLLNCHTIQHVLVGGLIGLCYGLIGIFLFNIFF